MKLGARLHVPVLTLYAFGELAASKGGNRFSDAALREYLRKELPVIHRNNIAAIGRSDQLPKAVLEDIERGGAHGWKYGHVLERR